MKAIVRTEGSLLDVVGAILTTATKTTVRKLIKHNRVTVDAKVQPRPDTPVRAGQKIEILSLPDELKARKVTRVASDLPFTILHEDKHLVVVDKPAGLLSIATKHEQQRTLYRMVSAYVKEATGGESRIFIVHRLDRDVSGVMVFAIGEPAKRKLQAGWATSEKVYRAVVEGRPQQAEGTVRSFLRENRVMRVVACMPTEPGAQEAVTHYRVIKATAARSELEVRIETGRKHQIRVHLASLGCPIVGDRVYGSGRTGVGMLLHAHSLSFDHPVTGERLTVTSPLPPRFLAAPAGKPGAGDASVGKPASGKSGTGKTGLAGGA